MSDPTREEVIMETLKSLRSSDACRLMAELLGLRRERLRDRLEGSDNPEARGRAKECKDLIQLLS